jgi:hypothetical protein
MDMNETCIVLVYSVFEEMQAVMFLLDLLLHYIVIFCFEDELCCKKVRIFML